MKISDDVAPELVAAWYALHEAANHYMRLVRNVGLNDEARAVLEDERARGATTALTIRGGPAFLVSMDLYYPPESELYAKRLFIQFAKQPAPSETRESGS